MLPVILTNSDNEQHKIRKFLDIESYLSKVTLHKYRLTLNLPPKGHLQSYLAYINEVFEILIKRMPKEQKVNSISHVSVLLMITEEDALGKINVVSIFGYYKFYLIKKICFMVVRRIQFKRLCRKGKEAKLFSYSFASTPFNKQLSKLDIFNVQTLEFFI